MDRLEEYADEQGTSKSDAANQMIKQGLDVQESDMRLVSVETDGGIEQAVGNLQSDVDQLEKQLESTVDEFENGLQKHTEQYQKDLSTFYVALALSVLWLGTVQVVAAPWWLIAASGLTVLTAVIAWLARVSRWFL